MDKTEHYVREDVRGFLDMLEQMGGKGVEEVGAVDGRQQMRAMKAVAEADNRALAVHRDLTCPGPEGDIPLRLYDTKESRKAGPCVVFIHGGGFVIGDIEVYDSLCSEIAHQLDLPVVSVEYRLAPEHPFPAAPDDCEAAARWIASSPAELGREVTGLVISGLLVGGTFTAVVALSMYCGRQLAPHAASAALGALTACYGVGQILGPVVTARLLESSGSFAPGLLGAAAALIGAAVLLVPLGKVRF